MQRRDGSATLTFACLHAKSPHDLLLPCEQPTMCETGMQVLRAAEVADAQSLICMISLRYYSAGHDQATERQNNGSRIARWTALSYLIFQKLSLDPKSINC